MALIIAIAVLAAGGGYAWYRAQGPRYQGRTIAQWLAPGDPNRDLATNAAIRSMLAALGTNALQPLVRLLEPRDSLRLQAFRKISQLNGLPQFIRDSASERLRREQHCAFVAAEAIRLLWIDAEPAIPDLERFAQDTNSPLGGTAALWALLGLGSSADPAIARLKGNAPPARAMLVRMLMEKSWAAMLKHENEARREDAALGLSWLTVNAVQAIPELEIMCGSPEAEKREAAMRALSRLAKEHSAARDAILRATTNAHANTRELARETLSRFEGIRKLKTFE